MFKRMIAVLIAVSMLLQQTGFAQVGMQPVVSSYMQSLLPVDAFRPVQMRALSFDASGAASLFLDRGSDQQARQEALEQSVDRLMDYFYIGLALPNACFWVNLRPDRQDQIIDPLLEKTDLGKVLLEADLQLKKDLAALTAPNTPQGKAYWDKLYTRAESLFGQENAEIPTHTRPWIVPGEIIIKETPNGAYVYKAGLKVMLEEDYARDAKEGQAQLAQSPAFSDPRLQQLNDYSTQLIRSTILPMLTRQVNASRKYAQLRQAYYSLVLAQWFKSKRLGGESLLKRIDSKDLSGLISTNAWSKQSYFNDYKQSFEKGEYAKEETVRTSSGVTVRTYFSGGLNFQAPVAAYSFKGNAGGVDRSLVQVKLPGINNDGGSSYDREELLDPMMVPFFAEKIYQAAQGTNEEKHIFITLENGKSKEVFVRTDMPASAMVRLMNKFKAMVIMPRRVDGAQYTHIYWGTEKEVAAANYRGAGVRIVALSFLTDEQAKKQEEFGTEIRPDSGWQFFGPFDANTDRESLSPEERRHYDMLLDNDGGKSAKQMVEDMVNAGSHYDRSVIAKKLVAIGESAVEPLIKVLTGNDWIARKVAAHTLAKIGYSGAVMPMTTMLFCDDGEMRWIVAQELGTMGDTRAVESLEKVLRSDTYWLARREAATALGKLKGGIPELIRALADSDYSVRSAASDALKAIGEPAVGPLAVAMQSTNDTVRIMAGCALGGIKDPRSTKMLIASLSDSNKNVRLRAAQDLGDNQAVEAVDALIKTLADPQDTVRYAAVKALARIGDTRAVAPLEKVLADEKEWDTVADAAGRALYELSNKDGGIGFTMYKGAELRNAQRLAVAAEISKELEKPGSSDLPSIAFISDYHGDANRFAQLLSDALRQIAGFKGTLDPRDSIEVQLNKQGLSLKTLKSPIYLGGDLFDRGTEGIQCFMMVKEMVTLAPERIFYISGNHDFWAFGNLLGLHLPWYEGFRFYDESTPEQFIDALKGAQELIKGKQASNPELFESQDAFRWWTARLAEYNAEQDAFQAAFFDGKVKDLRAGFVKFYQDNSGKWNDQQIKAMEDFAGHFARIKVPDPYVGLNGVGKTSTIWWQDLHTRLMEAYNTRKAAGADELELAMWDRSLFVCEEAVKEVHDRLTRAMNEGQWWYFIFEAINTQAYASVEWWCKDWSSHKGWGEAVIAEINRLIDEGVLEGPKIDQSNYIDSPVLQAYAKFQRANFNLYLKDPYGNLYSHGWFPVQPDGSISMEYQGKEFKGAEIFGALDAITAEVADFSKSLSELREGLKVVNSWYADETTIIKPENIRQNREQIGVAAINKGIGVLNWTTGHNTLDKLDTQFLAQDGAYAHMEADNGMAPKFGGKGGYVLLGPQGICMRGFEDKESVKIVTAPASGINVHVGMPAEEYLGNVLTHLWVEGKDGGSLTYDRLEHMLGQMQQAGDKATAQQLAYVVTYVAGGLVNKAILAAAQLDYGQGKRVGNLLERMNVRQSRGYDGVASAFRPDEVVVKDAVEPLRQLLREENETIRSLISEALMRFEYDSKDGGLDDVLNAVHHELFLSMVQKKLEATPANEKLLLSRIEKEALLMELNGPGESLQTIVTVLSRLEAGTIEELKVMAENTVELKERGIPEKLEVALQLRPNFGPQDAPRMDGGKKVSNAQVVKGLLEFCKTDKVFNGAVSMMDISTGIMRLTQYVMENISTDTDPIATRNGGLMVFTVSWKDGKQKHECIITPFMDDAGMAFDVQLSEELYQVLSEETGKDGVIRFDGGASVENLTAELENILLPKKNRAAAASALAEKGTEAVETLISLLSADDIFVRQQAAAALGTAARPMNAKVIAALIEAVDDPVTRAEAATSLGEIGNQDALEHLLKNVRKYVADASAHEKVKAAIERLKERGIKDRATEQREKEEKERKERERRERERRERESRSSYSSRDSKPQSYADYLEEKYGEIQLTGGHGVQPEDDPNWGPWRDGGQQVGGIDFRSVPAQAVNAALGMPAVDIAAIKALAESSKMANLDKEWAQIEQCMRTAQLPTDKVKEFVAVCSIKGSKDQLARVQETILHTIKMEEACALETSAQERELLVMLESI